MYTGKIRKSVLLYLMVFTETAGCKFLRGLAVIWPETFLFCPLYVLIHFSASFCTAHCALDFARDHAP